MLMPKVNREYKKLFRLYKRVDIEREIILISDSKRLTIKNIIPRHFEKKISVIAEKGATVWNEPFERKLLKHVEEVNNLIVLIWLGTCEITKKEGKYASLRDYPFQHIENTLTEYRTLRDKKKKCPYYYITRYNKAITLREKGKFNKVETSGRDLREKITDNSANVRYTEGPNTSLTRTMQNHLRVHRDRNNNQRKYTSLTRTVRFNTHIAYSG